MSERISDERLQAIIAGGKTGVSEVRRIAHELLASRASPPPAAVTRIKPLEFIEAEDGDGVWALEVLTIGGRYELFHKASDVAKIGIQVAYNAFAGDEDGLPQLEILGYGKTLDDAKAIAQAHHGARIRAALVEAGEPEGWKLVPVKITDAMREEMGVIEDGPARPYQEVWEAMLAAAPTRGEGK